MIVNVHPGRITGYTETTPFGGQIGAKCPCYRQYGQNQPSGYTVPSAKDGQSNAMLCGDPGLLAIESEISQPYEELSLRALGLFVIHVRGHIYGVKLPDATMLANSFDEVKRRIAMRGHHSAEFATDGDAGRIASAYLVAEYEDATPQDDFLGLPASEFCQRIKVGELVWAPDGDEAFDDGSHVLQFDVGDRVRLIAFRRDYGSRGETAELQDLWLDSSYFYEVLQNWHDGFLNEWQAMLKPRS